MQELFVNKMKREKVAVAMSGGVDSSVAALLLKQEGYDVSGVIMEIYNDSIDTVDNSCHACFGPGEKKDIEDAHTVAKKLGIPLHIINLKDEYREKILDSFVKEYKDGNTPNPCIKCNREMKFGAIVRELHNMGIEFDFFATGHYARIYNDESKNRILLKKALDLKKDQSYFLYYLKRTQLEKLMFPLGTLKKEDVRAIAEEYELDISDKPESQDFIDGGYYQLFKEPQTPGPILNTDGKTIGEHKGIIFYTVGQRRGIGIPAVRPLYVITKDKKRNAIIVGEKEHLLGEGLIAKELNWLSIERPVKPIRVKARIRYMHKEAEAEVIPETTNRAIVKFKEPQMSITPGQSVVFYDKDIVVGGGIIEREIKNDC